MNSERWLEVSRSGDNGALIALDIISFGGSAAGNAVGVKICNLNRPDECWNKTRYFDENTEIFLGNTKDEAAAKLNEKGHELLRAGRYTEAAKYHKNAYYTSSSSCNQNYKNNWDNAEAAELNKTGNGLKAKGNYEEAISRYEEAFNKCPDIEGVFRNNRKLYQNSKASAFNDWGAKLFEEGNYTGAADKYKSAYEQCTDLDKRKLYQDHMHKAQVELDAITLNGEGDIAFNEGRYTDAKAKYQAAHSKSTVVREKGKYIAGITKAQAKLDAIEQVDQAIARFNEVILSDDTPEDDLLSLCCIFDILVTEHKDNPEVVNRLLVLNLRISRNALNNKLNSSDDEQDRSEILSAITNLIETEQEVLRDLGINDEALEQELARIEDELENLENLEDINDEVAIQGLAERVIDLGREVEQRVVGQLEDIHLERGNSLEVRDPLIAFELETYYMKGMDELLQLRIASTEVSNLQDIKLLPSMIVDLNVSSNSLYEIAKQLAQANNEYTVTIIPLLIKLQNDYMSDNISNHWIGLVSKKDSNGFTVSYLDSENSGLPKLNEIVLETYKAINPDCKVSFRKIESQQQRYNNCGPELIENIILYLTGSRVEQEEAVYAHSSLWEQSLILEAITKNKDKAMSTLSKKSVNCRLDNNMDNGNEVDAQGYDVLTFMEDSISLSGAIEFDMEI